MTQALAVIAISAAANPVAGSRGNARNGVDAAPDSSSFASLLGPQAEAPGDAPKAAADDPDKENFRGSDHDDDQQADAESVPADTSAQPPVSAQLPAWLLALRLPTTTAGAGDTAAWIEPANSSSGVPQSLNKLGFVDSPQAKLPTDQATAIAEPGISSTVGWGGLANPNSGVQSSLSKLGFVNSPQATALDTLAAQAGFATVQASDQVLPLNADKALSIAASTPATPSLPDPAAALRQMLDQPLALDAPDASLGLSERLRWLAQAGVQEARLQLHPRELGSVDIRIRIEGQSASVWFGADHAHARAALEAAMPTLRERFAADGLALSQAQVGGREQPSAGQGRPDAQATPQRRASSNDVSNAVEVPASTPTGRGIRHEQIGLIDRYV